MAGNDTGHKHVQQRSGFQNYSCREAAASPASKHTKLILTTILPSVWWEGCVKSQLQSLCNLRGATNIWHKTLYGTTKYVCCVCARMELQLQVIISQQFNTWSSIVISVPNVLSVFHFSVKVRPYSALLYLVSRVPETLLVSVLEEPDVLNSCTRQF